MCLLILFTPTVQALAPEAPPKTTIEVPIEINIPIKEGECSCVSFARKYIPNLPFVEYASDFEPNSGPMVGGAVLFDYKGGGHIAVITGFQGGDMHIIEANFHDCEVSERVLSLDDPHIRGYINLPSRQ